VRFAYVIGTVVATIKDPSLTGLKLLLIQPTDHTFQPKGPELVAVDGVGVGEGEYVYWEDGMEAAIGVPGAQVVSDCTILGIVDRVDAGGVCSA
jgi:carbon dioxide concentrating mechanism protein CcmL